LEHTPCGWTRWRGHRRRCEYRFETAGLVTWTRRGAVSANWTRSNSAWPSRDLRHLDLLAEQGRLVRTELDGVRHYTT